MFGVRCTYMALKCSGCYSEVRPLLTDLLETNIVYEALQLNGSMSSEGYETYQVTKVHLFYSKHTKTESTSDCLFFFFFSTLSCADMRH